ncbi:MAG TPA: lysophospholipid acyltransferase family protein [Sphingomonadaceae bacterium]|nr:lysophospholipid acyltransferase family protein [Sphingomonadaceae bacterium]
MGGALALEPPRIKVFGWLLIASRLLLMLALLLLCLPLHGLWKLLRLDRFWPRVFLSGIAAICGLQIERRGRALPGALLVANHVSWLDIPALAKTAGSAFVAHEGLSAFPLLKFLCRLNETVFVARHDRASIARQVADVRQAIDNGGTLTLFAEGTTSDGTGLLPFKSALFSAVSPLPEGVAVQPVLLAYEDVPGIAWVGDEHGLDNFKRILARLRPLRLTVHFLPPLQGEQLTSRKTMAAAAQEAIGRALGH